LGFIVLSWFNGLRKITGKNAFDFDKGWGSLLLRPLSLLIFSTFFVLVMLSVFGRFEPFPSDFVTYQSRLGQSATSWSQEMLASQAKYSRWLELRGTSGEQRLFNSFSASVFRRVSNYSGEGTLSGLFVDAHFAYLRVIFFLIASSRLWIFLLILAFLNGIFSLRVYRNNDLLGRTGNSRLYFSGIRAGLENLTREGIPDNLIPGLACPPKSSTVVARESAIGKILQKYGVLNSTNLELTAVIIAAREYPAFVGRGTAGNQLEEILPELLLPGLAEKTLQIALEIHSTAQQDNNISSKPAQFTPTDGEDLEEYLSCLQQVMEKVLTPRLRLALKHLPAHCVATIVLAYQAGKVLAFQKQGGRWFRVSTYDQLSARAVLHSLPAFGSDYDYEARTVIRRALIYGARSSVFGPVRFARDLSDQTRALRQWVEVMMATPKELSLVADEIELSVRIVEIHEVWTEQFFEKCLALSEDTRRDMFSTGTGLLFLPISAVTTIMQESMEAEEIDRLHHLVSVVSTKQRETSMLKYDQEETLKDGIPEYERILPPLVGEDGEQVVKLHEITSEDVKYWGAIRVVLYTYGWLARRVGDYTVPESGIIYVVLDGTEDASRQNQYGLIGLKGSVVFRAARLKEGWGKDWMYQFNQAKSAKMAETSEQYDKLMQRISDDYVEEEMNA